MQKSTDYTGQSNLEKTDSRLFDAKEDSFSSLKTKAKLASIREEDEPLSFEEALMSMCASVVHNSEFNAAGNLNNSAIEKEKPSKSAFSSHKLSIDETYKLLQDQKAFEKALLNFAIKEIQEAKSLMRNGLIPMMSNVPKDKEIGKYFARIFERKEDNEREEEYKLFKFFQSRFISNLYAKADVTKSEESKLVSAIKELPQQQQLGNEMEWTSEPLEVYSWPKADGFILRDLVDWKSKPIKVKKSLKKLQLSGRELEKIFDLMMDTLKDENMRNDVVLIFHKKLERWIESVLIEKKTEGVEFPGAGLTYPKNVPIKVTQKNFVKFILEKQKLGKSRRSRDTDVIYVRRMEIEDWLMKGMPEITKTGLEANLPPLKTVIDDTGNYPEFVGLPIIRPTQRKNIKAAALRTMKELKTDNFVIIAKDVFDWIKAGMRENFPMIDNADVIYDESGDDETCRVHAMPSTLHLQRGDIEKWLQDDMPMALPDGRCAPLLEWLDLAAGRNYSRIITSFHHS